MNARLLELATRSYNNLSTEELEEIRTILVGMDVEVESIIDENEFIRLCNIVAVMFDNNEEAVEIEEETKLDNIMVEATLYQIADNPDFDKNFKRNMEASLLKGVGFVPVSEMEAVNTYVFEITDHKTILERIFCDAQDEGAFNYSMSVGDVVNIEDDWYRCTSFGWDNINEEVEVTEEVEEEIDNSNNEEDEEMNKEKAVQEAQGFIESVKGKAEEGFKFFITNAEGVKKEFEKLAGMSNTEAEKYIAENAESFFNNIMGKFEDYRKDMKEGSELFPNLKVRYEKCDNIIGLIKEILDDDQKNGWGKFVDIVKSIIMWLVRLMFKVASVVLKLAFTVAVGAIKIGCTAVTTGIKAIGVVNKEIVKPAVKAGKAAWNTHKENKAERAEIKKELFSEVTK